MESLWKSEVFTADDFRVFRYRTDPVEGAVENVPDCTTFYTNTNLLKQEKLENWLPEARKRTIKDWDEWLNTAQAKPTVNGAESFALALLPTPPPLRPSRSQDIPNPASLRKLPISEKSFKSIVEKFSIHHALPVILDRGVPTISRIQCEINGKNCYIYTLRVEHTLREQTAVTITHFRELKPSSSTSNGTQDSKKSHELSQSETYAVILGFKDDDTAMLKKCLQDCKESVFNPFTLIKAFLRIERRRRFRELDHNIVRFLDILQKNNGTPALGAEAASEVKVGAAANVEDPKNLIELYLRICTLKNRLMAWNTQIIRLKNYAGDFSSFTTGQPDIDPEVYLQCMVDEFNEKINKCDMALQGASLAFQRETAHLARQDSARSIEIAKLSREDSARSIEIAKLARLDSRHALMDGKQMKAIALLTMFFLPGTFVATLLAVPMFDSLKNTKRFQPWAWYPILFLPLTAIVIAAYLLWIYRYRSREQRYLDTKIEAEAV